VANCCQIGCARSGKSGCRWTCATTTETSRLAFEPNAAKTDASEVPATLPIAPVVVRS
jgi:hypothetical protein